MASQTVEKNAKATRPTTDPTKTAAFVFVNWYKENTFQNIFNFATETITANTTIYAKFNRPPTVRSGLSIKQIMSGSQVTGQSFLINDNTLTNYFTDADGDNTLVFEIINAYRNGDTTSDKKSSFSIFNHPDDGYLLKSTILPANDEDNIGLYKVRIKARDSFSSVEKDFVISSLPRLSSGSIDVSAITYDATVNAVSLISNYLRTGSGDDIMTCFTIGGIIDAGSGDNNYYLSISSQKLYFYNFNSGDKMKFRMYQVGNDGNLDTTKPAFKDFAFSSYANKSDVVATGADRIIYITSTGELYRDEDGDAVYKASDTSVNLKNGDNDRRLAKIYSSAYNPGDTAESNGTAATFTTDDFEIVDF